MHDETVYPDPFTFDPGRFIKSEPQYDPTRYVFGFGRRVCPGRLSHRLSPLFASVLMEHHSGSHFAEASLFLNIAMILSTFSILRPVNEDGKEFDPPVEYTSTITTCVLILQPIQRAHACVIATQNHSPAESCLVRTQRRSSAWMREICGYRHGLYNTLQVASCKIWWKLHASLYLYAPPRSCYSFECINALTRGKRRSNTVRYPIHLMRLDS